MSFSAFMSQRRAERAARLQRLEQRPADARPPRLPAPVKTLAVVQAGLPAPTPLKARAHPGGAPSIDTVVRAVAMEYGVPPAALTARVSLPRHIAMYLARDMGRSLRATARHMGFDASSVRGACNKISNLIGADPEAAARVARIRQRIEAALADAAPVQLDRHPSGAQDHGHQ